MMIEAKNLKKYFPVSRGFVRQRTVGWVKAVDGVSFSIKKGETFGLVGESGCGKTTIAKLILMLERPSAGSVHFRGEDVATLSKKGIKEYCRTVQAVFQDPYGSLNPRMRIGDAIGEPLLALGNIPRSAVQERVKEVLTEVGLDPKSISRFPHQFSGGQRQRIALARALASKPQIIVLDEPVSALDVSIRAQLMNLLKSLQELFALTYLLIAHDLSVVRHMSNSIGVMYVGNLVEFGYAEEVYGQPCHPYTMGLISAALPADPDASSTQIILRGEIPNPITPPSGCRFHPRCQYAGRKCIDEMPGLRKVGENHFVACHFDH